MGVLAYCTVGSNDLAGAKAFYDALLAVVGLAPLFEHPSGGRVYGRDGSFSFAVLGPYDGQPATVGNGSMVAFCFDRREEVDAFHQRALALGGATEGGPHMRGPGWYFAYCRDLDGNKLCAYCLEP
ncbi:VOC family protein [Sphingobium fuliginis]|uniref:VOC family protein n=1 Tax=Sphingobium fuliginis ATCC 27551 TaxID=1208342 RepID=A0A5B8CI27_SPHSA|nr:VOC family protein [Sphingobium fuliginis]QDC37737.1 VOC family protein [Sphingobium fuliginis ATCC 27551]